LQDSVLHHTPGSVQRFLHWLGRHELTTLILLAVLAGAVWGFVELADEVMEGETHAADEWLVLSLRTPGDKADPLGPGWVEELGRDFTALGGVGVLSMLTVAVLGYLLLRGNYRAALLVLISIGTGLAASFLLKTGFDRPRPDLVPHGSIVYTSSFPSGHSMLSAVTYLTLGALLARVHSGVRMRAYLLIWAALLTILVGFSRVYLGVHWPTDVLAGWMAGAAWAAFWWLVARYLQRRNQMRTCDPVSDDPALADDSRSPPG